MIRLNGDRNGVREHGGSNNTRSRGAGASGPGDNEGIGLVERKEYDRLKRKAIKFEKTNRKYILVIPCDGSQGWCEIPDYSALIYKYCVCMELGSPVTMTDDMDSFYIQYEIGRIRTRGFDTVRRRLKKVGLYAREVKKEGCVIFELKRVFAEDELRKLREEEDQRQAQMNSIVKTQFADPALYQMLTEVGTRLHRICHRRLDKLSSVTNGRRIVKLIDEIIRDYFDLTMLPLAPLERMAKWQKMAEEARQLLVEMQIVAGLRLWTREECARLGEKIVEIEKRIERDMKGEAVRAKKKKA